MKRFLSLISLLVIACLLLTACGGPATQQTADEQSESTAETAQPQVETEPEFIIKLGHGNDAVDTSWFHLYAAKFKELVENYSDGRIRVDEYPSFQLGDEQEMMRSVSIGTLEATIGALNNFNVYAPSMGFFTLPYMFENTEEARAVIDNMMPELVEIGIEESGARLLGITDAGFRTLTTSKKPVTKLSDFEGLKIRVAPNPIMIATYEAWGVSPIPIAWSETYTALQQGTADGHDNPYNAHLAMRMYEVQDYCTDIDYIIQTNAFILSEQFYQSLPDDLKEAVDRAAQETIDFSRELTDEALVSEREQLDELGLKMVGQPEDMEEWVSRAKSVWPQFYELIGGGDAEKGEAMIEKVEEYKADLAA